MPRRSDYAGAGSPLGLPEVASLGSSWVLQPKLDGMYAVAATDASGRLEGVWSRSGKPLSPKLHGLAGELVGAPRSLLVGELTASTEAGIRAAATVGQTALHLFDAVQINGERLAELPYSQRRDALFRMHTALRLEDRGRNYQEDGNQQAHDLSTGRYTRRTLRGWRRAPIVAQHPVAKHEELWQQAFSDPFVEGLVAVNLDAPLGRRGAKRKCKPVADLDAVVVSVDQKRALVHWTAAGTLFTVGCAGKELAPGQVWKVAYESFYDDGTPRFPRLKERRIHDVRYH